MSALERYPLPVAVGVLLGLSLGVLAGWAVWSGSSAGQWWAFGVGVLVGVVLGVLGGAAVWNRARLVCAWVVSMVPSAWTAHALAAGLKAEGRQLESGRHADIAIPVAKVVAVPHIKGGTLRVPVKTDHGRLNPANAPDLARELAAIMGLSSSSVEFPRKKKNPGYCWFILGAEDATA